MRRVMKEPDSEDRRTRLDEAILGRTPDITVDEVSASSQMSLDDTLRLWRALGFPDAGSEAAFATGWLQLFQIVFAPLGGRTVHWNRAEIYRGAELA